jgi:3',5'-cyclic AMP phosphodiesterase CpdA
MRKMAGGLLLALVLAAPVYGATNTTEHRTMLDTDGDNRLEPAAGEDHITRNNELGEKTGTLRPLHLKYFAQLTDSHIVDEESPLRVEWTDQFGLAFTSAYRPQEGITPQVLEQMVKQVRYTNSPVDGRPIELVMTTGDNTDNTQCNETRWLIDLMDGGTFVNPDSGLESPEQFSDEELCRNEGTLPTEPLPSPACDVPDNGSIYDGVRGGDRYYEPDSSNEPPSDREDGRGYSPDQTENAAETGRRIASRDFPGLFEAMNDPFRATGFGRLPWYGIFGNHDGLIQGNQPRDPLLAAVAVGCAKVTDATITPTGDPEQDLESVITEMLDSTNASMLVPPDPRRRPLRKSEYIAEHFRTSGYPVGHGFQPENVASGMGNYWFHPSGDERLRFIVLDSVAEQGLEEGNIDDPQFRWLHQQLVAADEDRELAVVFAHHSLRTMGQPPVSPFLPGDQGGTFDPNPHYGLGPRPATVELPCTETESEAEPPPNETLKCLLLRHPSVIAFVNGHEHANRVTPFERPPGQLRGGFWEINTASHIDWPQQSRVLDIVDNRDESLSIWSTIVDHGSPPEPGGPPAPRDGQAQSGEAVARLASISRELSFNDPHSSTGGEQEDGGARGGEEDRNVELVVWDPRTRP